MSRHHVVSRTARILVCVASVVLGSGVARAAALPETTEGAAQGVRASLARWMLPHCLTPDAGRAVNELGDTGRVAAALPEGWSLTGGVIRSDAIVLTVGDRLGHTYGVTLALPGARGGSPDAHGRVFAFHLTDSPPLAARDALLGLATLFDAAVPGTALQPCSGHATAPDGDRATRRRSVLSASVQAAIIVATIAFALAALPRDP